MFFNSKYEIRNGDVFFNGKAIKGIDAETFVGFGGEWYADKNKIFVFGTHRKTIDRGSFEYMNPVFVKDKKAVYDWEDQIKQADPVTFQVLDPGIIVHHRCITTSPDYMSYARDSKFVYFNNQSIGKTSVLREADVNTFISLRNGYGLDSNNVWFQKFVIKKADSRSWVYLGHDYSTDTKSVFYMERMIENVDHDRFTVIQIEGINLATDGTNYFWNDDVISKDQFIEFCEKRVTLLSKWLANDLMKKFKI